MAYPLIILGAGASFDSLENPEQFSPSKQSNLKNWAPPLTNDIFNRQRFDQIIDKYPDAKILSGQAYRIKEGFSFEDLLTHILTTLAPQNPTWYTRLMSLRLYLQELFSKISSHYHDPAGNYQRLIFHIEEHSDHKAIFVNFNYDLLLETNIPDIKHQHVDEYINGKIKVVKIHGACNWFRYTGKGYVKDADFKSGKDFLLTHAPTIFKDEGDKGTKLSPPIIKNADPTWQFYDPVPTHEMPLTGEVKYLIPELVLPINTKRDFVCPPHHIQILESNLSEIDRIIIIGWKGADPFLLNLLKKHLAGSNIPVVIVDPIDPEGIAAKIRIETKLDVFPLKEGFSEFTHSDHCQKVLSTPNMRATIAQINNDGMAQFIPMESIIDDLSTS